MKKLSRKSLCLLTKPQPYQRQAQNLIRTHIAENPADAACIWGRIESVFADANERGITVTAASLRRELTAAGFTLNAPPTFATDIARLRDLTRRNLSIARSRDGSCSSDY